MLATGRVPNTEGLGLDAAGVATDARGYIRVNDRLETTAPGVWAMGDVAGSPQFTHVALDDYRVVKANLSGGSRTTSGRLIPSCTFIDPELGRVGLGEAEARSAGTPIKVARLAVSAVPRARTLGETRGFMKAVVDPGTGRILGFTMLG
ncbi:FAD-dependent oxidoreductase, partial [Xanthomonas citri pv. citri]